MVSKALIAVLFVFASQDASACSCLFKPFHDRLESSEELYLIRDVLISDRLASVEILRVLKGGDVSLRGTTIESPPRMYRSNCFVVRPPVGEPYLSEIPEYSFSKCFRPMPLSTILNDPKLQEVVSRIDPSGELYVVSETIEDTPFWSRAGHDDGLMILLIALGFFGVFIPISIVLIRKA